VFEIKTNGGKDTISAGGRYDNVVGKYLGKPIPAVGISFGLDRISEIANIKVETTKAMLISIDKDRQMMKIAKLLRKEGVSCLTTSEKPGKALELANSLGIQKAVFIGEAEVHMKKFKLRDMKSGEEKMLSESRLISALKK
jgi:histidyl-tRNA synthetase